MHTGYLCYQKGDLDNAIYFFEIAHKTLPHDTASLLNLIYVYLDKKNYDQALQYARRLLAIQYHRPSIYTLISSIELHKGHIEEALATLDAGILKNQHDKMLYKMKANLLLDVQRELEAIDVIRKLIALSGETQYYAEIGAIYENLHLYDEAQATYDTCLRHHPYHVECLHGIGFLLFQKAENKKEKAYALPYEDTAHFRKLILEARQEYQAAYRYLERAHALNPDDQAIKELRLRVERRLIDE